MAETESQTTGVRVVAFAAMGVLTSTQEVAGALLDDVPTADPELVAEETLALLAVATARTVAAAGHAGAAGAVADLPLAYRDYLAGGALLDGKEDVADDAGAYDRIARKMAFYETHLPPGALPGPRLVEDKMALWMGRVSPPGLPDTPDRRLKRLGLVDLVLRHLQLVEARARMA